MSEEKDLKRDLSFLESYIGTALGIQTLSHYDKNYLTGDNATQSAATLEHLLLAQNKLVKIINNVKYDLYKNNKWGEYKHDTK